MQPLVQSFFHAETGSYSHVVYDRPHGEAVIIDPVLDFDLRRCRTSTTAADTLAAFVRSHGLTVRWILETHIHADHVSAAAHLATVFNCGIAIGRHVGRVIDNFQSIFDFEGEALQPEHHFHRLLDDGDRLEVGAAVCRIMHTPGHTEESLTYVIGDAAFVGDLLFRPDYGTGRCDFPGGDASQLYESIRRVLALPDATRMFLCHDYPPAGREPTCMTTVAQQKESNVHLRTHPTRQSFIDFRRARDLTLSTPALMVPAIQLNIRAGSLPAPARNGKVYLKLPVNVL